MLKLSMTRTTSTRYRAVHSRLHKAFGPARGNPCTSCGEEGTQWAYDRNDPDELTDTVNGYQRVTYSAKLEHYVVLCGRCHEAIDGNGFRKTHCVHGHEFTPDNTYIRPDNKTRVCRACSTRRGSERNPEEKSKYRKAYRARTGR